MLVLGVGMLQVWFDPDLHPVQKTISISSLVALAEQRSGGGLTPPPTSPGLTQPHGAYVCDLVKRGGLN